MTDIPMANAKKKDMRDHLIAMSAVTILVMCVAAFVVEAVRSLMPVRSDTGASAVQCASRKCAHGEAMLIQAHCVCMEVPSP